jgi:hypothetical protein
LNESTLRKIGLVFWAVYLLIPIFFGWSSYHSDVNEYDEKTFAFLTRNAG